MARIDSSAFVSVPDTLSRVCGKPPCHSDPTLRATDLAPMYNCPIEVIIIIFSKLPPLDIVRARAVSRFWKDTIDAATEIKYLVELHIDRMVDACPTTSLERRLLALQARRQAWGDPALAVCSRFTLPPGREFRRTYSDGILTRLVDAGNANFVLTQQDVGFGDKHIGTSHSGISAVASQNVPQHVKVDGGHLWDIQQNVWILVDPTRAGCVKIHMLTTGGFHPEAAASTLVVPDRLTINDNAELHLLGMRDSYFAMNVTVSTNQYAFAEYVVVWNWRTGFLASALPILDSASTRPHAFFFLSEKHFAICMDDYRSDTSSDSVVVMKAYGIPNSDLRQHNFDALHLATFGFPSSRSSQVILDPAWRYEAMGTAPAPGHLGRQVSQQERFFSETPNSFMLVIPVVLEAGDDDEGEGFFVTHAATVLTHLPSAASSRMTTETETAASSSWRTPVRPAADAIPVYVPWEAWGAKGARYIPVESSRIVGVSGERLMRWERLPMSEAGNSNGGRYGGRPMGFVLYDFNQARVRRTQLAAASGAKNALWPPVQDIPPSLLPDSRRPPSSATRGPMKDEMTLFDADVGGLPCLRMKWTLDAVASDSYRVRDVLMDESHILIMLGKSEESTECIAYTL